MEYPRVLYSVPYTVPKKKNLGFSGFTKNPPKFLSVKNGI